MFWLGVVVGAAAVVLLYLLLRAVTLFVRRTNPYM
jgi:hypothetical protein